jgi:hypothetical protein
MSEASKPRTAEEIHFALSTHVVAAIKRLEAVDCGLRGCTFGPALEASTYLCPCTRDPQLLRLLASLMRITARLTVIENS